MKRIKTFLLKFPESILIGSILLYWLATTLYNPIAFCLLIAILIQLKLKSKIVGIIVGALFLLASTYMIFALVSELSEFDTFTTDAWQLLLIGSSWLIASLIFSILMLYKYLNL